MARITHPLSNVETARLLSVDNHARNVRDSILQECIEGMVAADVEANPPQVIE